MSEESARVLKQFLKNNNLSISEFARISEISRFSVYKYLDGSNIHPKTAKKIKDNVSEYFTSLSPDEKIID